VPTVVRFAAVGVVSTVPLRIAGNVLVTVQLKLAAALPPRPSVTVTTVLNVPNAVGVPLMRPLEALMPNPVGRPVAL